MHNRDHNCQEHATTEHDHEQPLRLW
jgi:hypothetical protein